MDLNIDTVIGSTNPVGARGDFFPDELKKEIGEYNAGLKILHAEGRALVAKRNALLKNVFEDGEASPMARRAEIVDETIEWSLRLRKYVATKSRFSDGLYAAVRKELALQREQHTDRRECLLVQLKALRLDGKSVTDAIERDREILDHRQAISDLNAQLNSKTLLPTTNEAEATRAIEAEVRRALLF